MKDRHETVGRPLTNHVKYSRRDADSGSEVKCIHKGASQFQEGHDRYNPKAFRPTQFTNAVICLSANTGGNDMQGGGRS